MPRALAALGIFCSLSCQLPSGGQGSTTLAGDADEDTAADAVDDSAGDGTESNDADEPPADPDGDAAADTDGGSGDAATDDADSTEAPIGEEPQPPPGWSSMLADYVADSAFSPDVNQTYTGAAYEVFYWPWCTSSLFLDDPANLYGCAGACVCTGDEAPLDLRDYLDATTGPWTSDGPHFELAQDEVRVFGVNYLNRFNHPDFSDAGKVHQARMLATRLAMLGNNMVRVHHLDNPCNMFEGNDTEVISPCTTNVVNVADSEQLSNLVQNVELLAEAGMGVDLNLHTRRQVVADSSQATSDSADGVITDEEVTCDSGANKLLAYIGEDVRSLVTDFAEATLAQVLSTGDTLAVSDALQLIEITNENSLTSAYQSGEVHGMGCQLGGRYLTPYWATELEEAFQSWVDDGYGDVDTLAIAWSPDGTGASYTSTSSDDLLDGYGGDFEDFFPEFDGVWYDDTATANNTGTLERIFQNWGFTRASEVAVAASVSCDTLNARLCSSDRALELNVTRSPAAGTSLVDTYLYSDVSLVYRGHSYHLAACASTAACESGVYCSDGVDNDGDLRSDTDDPDCSGQRQIRQERSCLNAIDDDADGQIDAADADCSQAGDCSDGDDDDGDGAADILDGNCTLGESWENPAGSGSGYATENYLPIHYNADLNSDGLYDSTEALTLSAGQAYTLSLEYQVIAYADQNGSTSCTPVARVRVTDANSTERFVSGVFALSTDASTWHTLEACVGADAEVQRATLAIDLGSDCASMTLRVREAALAPTSEFGRYPHETTLETIGLRPFSEWACMTSTRKDDTLQFLVDAQVNHFIAMRSAIRGAGYAGPLENGNCFYDLAHSRSLAVALGAADPLFTDGHGYWDQYHTEVSVNSVDQTCYHAESLLSAYDSPTALLSAEAVTTIAKHPDDTPYEYNQLLLLARSAQRNVPYVVSEHATTFPNPYQAESLFLAATYASFQDWAGYFWLGYNWSGGNPFRFMDSYEVGSESLFATLENPVAAATMPLSALILRKDYAASSLPTITLDHSRTGILESFANDDTSFHVDGFPAALALVHPVRMDLVGPNDTAASDFQDRINSFSNQAVDRRLESEDGRLLWDFESRYFRLNAPKAQGFVGFLQGETYEAANLAVHVENPDYALVAVAALDDQGLLASEQLFLTVASYGRDSGQAVNATLTENSHCYASTDWGGEYTEAAYPSGAVALSLGASASSIQVYATDALGRRASVSVQSGQMPGEFIFEFNRQSYAFASAEFAAGGSLAHTFWFLIDVERVEVCGDGMDNDGDEQFDCEDVDCVSAAACS